MYQANHGKVVGKIIGGNIPKIRGIEQGITIHGGNRSVGRNWHTFLV